MTYFLGEFSKTDVCITRQFYKKERNVVKIKYHWKMDQKINSLKVVYN